MQTTFEIARIENTKEGIFAVFGDEETAENFKFLFPYNFGICCFGGYMNAIKLTDNTKG